MQRVPGIQFSRNEVLGRQYIAAAATKNLTNAKVEQLRDSSFLLEIVLDPRLLSKKLTTGTTEGLHSWYCTTTYPKLISGSLC